MYSYTLQSIGRGAQAANEIQGSCENCRINQMTCALFEFSCYSYRLCTGWTKILVDLETILLCVNRRVHEEFMK